MIHISNLNGKLAEFRAISVNTLSNKFCQKMHNIKPEKEIICSDCYSWALLQGFRKNVAVALQRNSDLLGSRVLAQKELPRFHDKEFRFNAHGELINEMHLQNLINIAEWNSQTMFSLWSKRKGLIKNYFDRYWNNPSQRYGDYVNGVRSWENERKKPSNLILVYSNPVKDTVQTKPPAWFDKVFNNVYYDNFLDQQNCTGQKCKDCLLCYQKNTTNVIVEKVKNYG